MQMGWEQIYAYQLYRRIIRPIVITGKILPLRLRREKLAVEKLGQNQPPDIFSYKDV